jgi:hypothetical protein
VGLGRTENRAWKGRCCGSTGRGGRGLAAVHGGRAEALQNMRPHGAAWRGGSQTRQRQRMTGRMMGGRVQKGGGGAATDWPPSKRGEGRLYTLCGHTGAARRAVHIAIKMGQREAGGGGGGEQRRAVAAVEAAGIRRRRGAGRAHWGVAVEVASAGAHMVVGHCQWHIYTYRCGGGSEV